MWCKIISVVLLCCQLASAGYDCSGSSSNEGGLISSPEKNKAGFGEFPWTVALYKKDASNPHCAGSIIDESTVLTTAFCVKQISNPSDLIIRAGIWDLNRTKVEDYLMQQRVASDVISHPQYSSPDPIDNDIAIVRVNQPFKFAKHVQKVCLHDGSQKIAIEGCIASSWGSESFENLDQLSQFMKKIQMDNVDHDICEKQLKVALNKETFTLPDSFLCAGGNENDLCIGDSGAPLVCPVAGVTNQFVLTGMASYGVSCFTETPGVYTNVVKFFDWIRENAKL